MSDLFLNWGTDLSVAANGDVLTVDQTVLGQQRVIRRLLTNPLDYIWHPPYGAGLPSQVGRPYTVDAIKSLVRAQMLQEAAVAQNPPPTIKVTPIANGVNVTVSYVDAVTGQQATLSFDINQ